MNYKLVMAKNNIYDPYYVINASSLVKIKDLTGILYNIWCECCDEFINKIINKHPNKYELLQNLGHINVLVGYLSDEGVIQENEKSWKDILSTEQYKFIKEKRHFILGYMLVSEDDEDKKNHYIEYFDTIVRKFDIGRIMINKYEKEYNINLVPREIIISSAKYWCKILWLLDDDGNIYKKDIDNYITDNNILYNKIKWEHLYNLCIENNNNTIYSDNDSIYDNVSIYSDEYNESNEVIL